MDQRAEATSGRQQPGERGDDRAVGPAQPWSRGAALQHDKLVAQDEDLDLFGESGRACTTIQLTNVAKIR